MKEVKIDFDAAGGVDLDRLATRAFELTGERVGTGRYHVTGGDSDHWVDLYTTSHPRCDCGDHGGPSASASTSSPPCCARGTTAWWPRSGTLFRRDAAASRGARARPGGVVARGGRSFLPPPRMAPMRARRTTRSDDGRTRSFRSTSTK